jgi:hypothetical protein
MEIQVAVFRVVTPCSDVVGKQRFGVLCWSHLQGETMDPCSDVVEYQILPRHRMAS